MDSALLKTNEASAEAELDQKIANCCILLSKADGLFCEIRDTIQRKGMDKEGCKKRLNEQSVKDIVFARVISEDEKKSMETYLGLKSKYEEAKNVSDMAID